MYKYISISLLTIALLSGCSSDSDPTNIASPANIESVVVSSLGSTTTIDKNVVYDLEISGMNNTITIADNNNIDNLDISGLNNILTIGTGVNINAFNINGADNTVYAPIGSNISFTDTGVGNSLIYQ